MAKKVTAVVKLQFPAAKATPGPPVGSTLGPYGINIPAILLHYNKCVNEGNVPKDSQDPNYREARRAFLVGYDRSVPKLRQANHCVGCKKCNKHCPQRIDIPKELQRIDNFVEKLKQNIL